MADVADYADRLRETLLATALVPLAGFATASFWLRESLERTTKFGGDVVASTVLARFTGARPGTDRGKPDSAVERLALDLLESARSFVRSMVRLPADTGVYFTGELEARFNALLDQIQPEAEKNLIAYADTQLQQLRQEVDRLLVLARAEVGRPLPIVRRAAYKRAPSKRALEQAKQARANRRAAQALVTRVGSLRKLVDKARPSEGQKVRANLVLDAPLTERFTAARAKTRVLVRLQEVLRQAETEAPRQKKQIARVKALVNKRIPAPQISTSAG
jgi:hypothetical protein